MGIGIPWSGYQLGGYHGAKRWTHSLFEVGGGGRLSHATDIFIMALIIANVLALMLETVDAFYVAYGDFFLRFEYISVGVFTGEYVGRFWSSTEFDQYRHPVTGRLQFAATKYMIIDLLAILPFYAGALLFGGMDLRFLRGLRLLRFLRLFKLTRYSESMQIFFEAIERKRHELFITFSIGMILMIVASSAMYFAEQHAQPDTFSSIPATLWWGVITLTTVGYGNVYPVTTAGRVLGAVVAIIGIGIVALPASILASGFIEVARGEVGTCPHCGREITKSEEESDELV